QEQTPQHLYDSKTSMKGKNNLNQPKNEIETLGDINMDVIRSQYNSTGPMDMRSLDPARDAKYFSKWEKNLKKLNGFIDQINRNGSNFELPQELRGSKLSTISAEYINKTYVLINSMNGTTSHMRNNPEQLGTLVQDLIHTHIGPSSFDTSDINASKSHENLTRTPHEQVVNKLTDSEAEDSDLVIENPLLMKDVVINYNRPLMDDNKVSITPSYKQSRSPEKIATSSGGQKNVSIVQPSSSKTPIYHADVIPSKRSSDCVAQTSYKRAKSSCQEISHGRFESVDRSKWREETPGHIVLLDSDDDESDAEDKFDP
ncbi:29362_t:CDS:2, partial [Racocetra persica]